MYGDLKYTTALSVVAIALGAAAASSAQAADLGGNCCADLEERIAELEATTARKGNRKVSLEIYGQVNEGLLFWDDGVERNAYVVTNDNSRTRIGFRGKAKINGDLEAGYRLEIGVRSANSKRFTQDNDEGNDTASDVGFDMRDSYWYLKSKTFGGVSVGLQAEATDAITESNLTQTKDFSKYSDVEDTGLGLFLRSSVNGGLSGISYRRLIGDGGDQPGEGDRRHNLIKYETPTWNGFSASTSWGEDDVWDVALRYAGEFGGFNLAAGVGYGKQRDGGDTNTSCNATLTPPGGQADQQCDQFGGSFSILHEATGLFVNAAAGVKTDDLIDQTPVFAGTAVDDSQDFWAVQAGIERKFNEYGKTTIYGEYYDYEGGGNTRRTVGAGDPLNVAALGGEAGAVWGTGVQVIGAGIAQGFDKAALTLYLSYRHVEADLILRGVDGATGVADGAIASSPVEDLDLVFAGGIIKF
jgi:predicted porin